MTATSTLPTFAHLCALDPRLSALLAEARRDDSGTADYYCAMARWPAYKRRLSALVGFFAHAGQPAELLTSDAYEVAHQALLQALPSCRGCCHAPRPRRVATRRDGTQAVGYLLHPPAGVEEGATRGARNPTVLA